MFPLRKEPPAWRGPRLSTQGVTSQPLGQPERRGLPSGRGGFTESAAESRQSFRDLVGHGRGQAVGSPPGVPSPSTQDPGSSFATVLHSCTPHSDWSSSERPGSRLGHEDPGFGTGGRGASAPSLGEPGRASSKPRPLLLPPEHPRVHAGPWSEQLAGVGCGASSLGAEQDRPS